MQSLNFNWLYEKNRGSRSIGEVPLLNVVKSIYYNRGTGELSFREREKEN
jgi:hypothetical protein